MATKKTKAKATEGDEKLNQPDEPTATETPTERTTEDSELAETPAAAEQFAADAAEGPVRVRTTRTIRRTHEDIEEIVEEFDAPPLLDATGSEYPARVG